jgi:hypothetical protein
MSSNSTASGFVALVVCILCISLAPGSAHAEPQARSLAELAASGELKAGKDLFVTLKLHRDGGYDQKKVKFVRITDSAMYVEVGEDFLGLTTDLRINYLDDPGRVLPFEDPGLAVLEIPEARIRRVAGIDSLLNGILIGAGVGAAPAILLAAGACANDEPCSSEGNAMFIGGAAALGAGIGLLADYGRQREGEVFFEAPAPRPPLSVSVAPIVSRKGKGLLFVITW